jgi:hypothetical protein
MSIVNKILENKLTSLKEDIFAHLNAIASKRLEEKRREMSADIYGDDISELLEGNIVRQGRIQRIRRRIRRNAKGQITVQRNVRRSAVKGFRISGSTVKRIPAAQRIQKARKLKRYWKTKGRARLNRTLLKRKMSMRRRKSMGIK